MRTLQANSPMSLSVAHLNQGPEVSPLGPCVIAEAKARGKDPIEFAAEMLCNHTEIALREKNAAVKVIFFPGHKVNCGTGGRMILGPTPAEVMVIGKMPWKDELEKAQLFSGASGLLWKSLLAKHGVNFSDWYLTNVCRFMPPFGEKSVKASWIKECRWFLEQELHIVKPKYLLLMGADAVRAVLGSTMKVASLASLRGMTTLEFQGAKVCTIIHPAAACAEPALQPQLESDLMRFAGMTRGENLAASMPTEYRIIDDEASLTSLVDFFISSKIDTFSIDCEWGGTEGSDYLTGKLRTIQFSHAPGYAYCVVLRRAGLVDAFKPNIHAAIVQLKRLLCRKGVKLAGHNLKEDLKWLIDAGLDVTYPAYHGYDTMLMHHLLFPSDNQGLEVLTMKFSDLGRYDFTLNAWLKEHGYKERQFELYGYGHVPDELLHPYACRDVDVCIRALPILENALRRTPISRGAYELNGIRMETLYDLYREIVHAAMLPIMEVEMTGVPVDQERLIKLVSLFLDRRNELAGLFQDMLHWPNFNFRSVDQCRELLFGDQPGKKRSRPEGATCLKLTPIKTTGKPSLDWERVPPDRRRFHNPSTDAESLQILAAEAEEARYLMELRFVDQVIKNFLRPAEYDAETGTVDYTKGLVSVVHADGRIRTTLSQLTDTGRYRSCVKGDTPILTRRGVMPISHVVVGDEVWTHRRRWRRVLAVYVHPEQEMCDVQFGNGKVLTCTYYHRVLTCRQEWKEIRHAKCEQIASAEQRVGCSSSQRVPNNNEAGRGDCQAVRGKPPYGSGNDPDPAFGRAVQTAEKTSVPKIQAGRKQPDVREVSPGFGSEALLGLQGVSDAVGRQEAVFPAPHRGGQRLGDDTGKPTGMVGHSPHRRGPSEQRTGQPGNNDEAGTQTDSREIPTEPEGLGIKEINPAGVYPVYDIYVEEDNSYCACGTFHHNSKPNLQNLPKSQESELRKLFARDLDLMKGIKGWEGKSEDFLKEAGALHPDYYSIRSCFIASPGHVLVEADYSKAELFVMAYMAKDANMIAVLEDPTRDMHSENAVAAFRLPCDAKDVKKLYPAHRVMAKSVAFGIIYGRGASALVREIKKEGIEVTADQTQQMIDAFYDKYPRVYDYVQACKLAVVNPGYVETAFGRRRWFPYTKDDAIRAAQERQATNMPIQGTVADALSVALMNMWRYRRFVDANLPYRLLLPVHDAVIVETPYTHVDQTEEMLSLCMTQGARVPHIGLTFKVDIEVSKRWNEHCGKTEAIRLASQEKVA